MVSNIVQLNFCNALGRVSVSCLLFKFKFIIVEDSVTSIRREILSNCRQRIVVDELIHIDSGMPQRSVLGSLLFNLYISEMFQLVGNRLYA